VQELATIISKIGIFGDEWSALSPNRFTPGKELPVLIEQQAGWAPKPVWAFGSRDRYSDPAGIRTPNSTARSSIYSTSASIEI
jgi:hypothetical protein